MTDFEETIQALLTRSVLLQRGTSYIEAEVLARRATAQDPDHANAYCIHDGALFHLNRIEDAVIAFERAVALKSDYTNALCNVGSAPHRLKKYSEAERAYRGALAVDENYALAQTTGHDSLDTSHHCGTAPTRGAGRYRRVSGRRWPASQ